jgi:hypothetical protein
MLTAILQTHSDINLPTNIDDFTYPLRGLQNMPFARDIKSSTLPNIDFPIQIPFIIDIFQEAGLIQK